MKTLFSLALALLCAAGPVARGDEPPALSLAQALKRTDLQCAWTGNGRDQLVLAVGSTAKVPVGLAIPAGLIARNPAGERVIVLHAAELSVLPHTVSEVTLPVAALSTKNGTAPQSYHATADTEPRLAALLKYLADKPDAPKVTAQLATLALLADVTFAQWQLFLAPQPDAARPTPTEIVQAVDAIGLLRTLAPAKTFAIATDGDLKLRALRNPWCRAKAMRLYGLTLPGDGGTVPADFGQLLHTAAGDNCPVCRQRAQMQAGPGGL